MRMKNKKLENKNTLPHKTWYVFYLSWPRTKKILVNKIHDHEILRTNWRIFKNYWIDATHGFLGRHGKENDKRSQGSIGATNFKSSFLDCELYEIPTLI
jgi:hypothetical protein